MPALQQLPHELRKTKRKLFDKKAIYCTAIRASPLDNLAGKQHDPIEQMQQDVNRDESGEWNDNNIPRVLSAHFKSHFFSSIDMFVNINSFTLILSPK